MRSFLRRYWQIFAVAFGPLLLLWLALFAAQLQTALIIAKPSKLILDRQQRFLGEVLGEHEHRGYWPLPALLPKRIVLATIETEDRHFYQHAGIYWPSVGRALWQDLSSFKVVSGASTIAMQLARLQHAPGPRSLGAKIREASEALLLIRRYGHDAVLRQYLTHAPYGNRVRGAVYAARYYFAKPVEDLSWLQAAYLAALPQAPGRMNPYHSRGRALGLRRAHRILHQLHRRGLIDDETLRQALASDLYLNPKQHRDPSSLHALLQLSAQAAQRPDLTLTATLDQHLQSEVHQILASGVKSLRSRSISNGAALVVDHRTGEVLAAVGSVDYFAKEARGAINFLQVKRSPGSTLKPFIYALALDSGNDTAASEFSDTMMAVVSEGGRSYLPSNIGGQYYGPLLLRQALGNSRNIPALRLLSEIGLDSTLQLLQRGGVTEVSLDPSAYGLGLALGNLPVTVRELAQLYTAIAQDGRVRPLRDFIDDDKTPGVALFSAASAAIIRNILSDDSARIPAFRPGNALEFMDFAVAAKTGTSQGYRDAWTVLLSDRLIVVVWMGNHDWSRSNHVGGATAAKTAHQIMLRVMREVDPHIPPAPAFLPPSHWVQREVCPLSGGLAGPHCPHRRSEFFSPGSEPVEVCAYHRSLDVDKRNGLRASPSCAKRFVRAQVGVDLPQRYQRWARHQHLDLLPTQYSPLCSERGQEPLSLKITSPRDHSRYLWDPDTPSTFSSLRLSATVHPWDEPIVWIVDDKPLTEVSFPHDAWLPLTAGKHRIQAAFKRRSQRSQMVEIVVEN